MEPDTLSNQTAIGAIQTLYPTPPEYTRQEALNQARMAFPVETADVLIKVARLFESYLRNG